MRRRSPFLSALAAGLVLLAVSAVPAVADEAPVPATSGASAPAADPTPTDSGTTAPAAPADPVDLALLATFPGGDAVRGGTTDVAYDVSGKSPDATLTLTLPAGLTVTTADIEQRRVTCTPAAGSAVCDLGAVSGLSLVNVGLAVAADAAIGAHLHVTSTVAPVPGPDANPGDNAVGTDITVVGHADVTQNQSTKLIDVPLGGSAPFTVTLHNNGPDPATNTAVRFSVQSNDDPRPELTGFTSADVEQANGAFVWKAGTIAVGGTVSLTVTVTATSPAVDSALAFSSSYDGVGEICVNAACESGAPIRTVAADAQGGSTSPATGPELANTGSDTGVLTLVAAGLLAVGGAFVAAGRRRRRLG